METPAPSVSMTLQDYVFDLAALADGIGAMSAMTERGENTRSAGSLDSIDRLSRLLRERAIELVTLIDERVAPLVCSNTN